MQANELVTLEECESVKRICDHILRYLNDLEQVKGLSTEIIFAALTGAVAMQILSICSTSSKVRKELIEVHMEGINHVLKNLE